MRELFDMIREYIGDWLLGSALVVYPANVVTVSLLAGIHAHMKQRITEIETATRKDRP